MLYLDVTRGSNYICTVHFAGTSQVLFYCARRCSRRRLLGGCAWQCHPPCNELTHRLVCASSADSAHALQEPVVLKIFTQEACFHMEKLLCSTAPVADAAGTTDAYRDNADGAATCQFSGFVFPPYSVSPRIESLEGWLQRRGPPDVASAMHVRPTTLSTTAVRWCDVL